MSYLSPTVCDSGALFGCSEPCLSSVAKLYLCGSGLWATMEQKPSTYSLRLSFSREAKTENKKYEKRGNC